MKTQMRFQKILFTITLVVAALTIVYALGFCTGGIAYLARYTNAFLTVDDQAIITGVNGNDVYWAAQDATDILLYLGIVFILIVVACYIFASNRRRNYYISNYITVGLLIVYAVVWAIVALVLTVQVHTAFVNDVNWEYMAQVVESDPEGYLYNDSTAMFWIGYVVVAIVLVDAAALGYNLIWKIKLMKGEKKLLEEGLVKEVV